MSDVAARTASPVPARARKATRADLAHVTETLALSFYDDPVLMWMVSDGPRCEQLLAAFFGAVADLPRLRRDVRGGRARSVNRWRNTRRGCPQILGLMEAKHRVEPHQAALPAARLRSGRRDLLRDGPMMWPIWRSPHV